MAPTSLMRWQRPLLSPLRSTPTSESNRLDRVERLRRRFDLLGLLGALGAKALADDVALAQDGGVDVGEHIPCATVGFEQLVALA